MQTVDLLKDQRALQRFHGYFLGSSLYAIMSISYFAVSLEM